MKRIWLASVGIVVVLLHFGCAGAEPGGPNPQATAPPAAAPEVMQNAPAADIPPPANDVPADAAAGNPPPVMLPRKVIRTGEITLAVERFSDTPQQIEALAAAHSGYIAIAEERSSIGERHTGIWTCRIPSERFDAFMAAARRLGEVRELRIDGKDVSEEYYDLEARVRNKQVEESRLLKHLEENTDRLDQILIVEREVSRVRQEIEQMEGRRRVMQDLTSMTTVTLMVQQREAQIAAVVPAPAPAPFGTRISVAFSQSLSALQTVGEVFAITAAILLPWALAVMVIVAVCWGLLHVATLGSSR